MYGHVGYRRSFRIREFYAALAFLVGISIGFMLTTRTRVQIIAPEVKTKLGESQSINKRCSTNNGLFEMARQNSNGNYVVNDEHSDEQAIEDNDNDNEYLKEDIDDIAVKEGVDDHDADDKKRFIFVGVMTAQKYLDTRAVAVHRTWSRNLAGRVMFFAGADAEFPPGLPVVRLPGVDDTYPPQKKSFLMLKYIYEHYGDRYEWFLRADDDVYIRGDRLESFLRSVNSSRPHFIGQAGTGNKEEFGQLHLERDENFCMGGPGVVFSRETLRRVAPNVRQCLKNLYSTHEDVEVGRCVRRFAGIPCTWSYEMQSIFYHNSSGDKAFTGNLKQKEVHRAITLHPIKQHAHFYRLHNYFQSLAIQDLRQKLLIYYRDMRAMIDFLKLQQNSTLTSFHSSRIPESVEKTEDFNKAIALGQSPSLIKTNPSNDSEVIKWDFIQHTIYSFTSSNPRRKLETSLKETFEDVVAEIMDMINKYSKQRGRIIEFKDILYGYHRLDHRYGVDYILDMLLVYKKYRGHKMTIPVRKHVYVQQSFTELEVREMLPASIPNKINFVLPLSGRFHIFERFMKNFDEVCLVTGERVSLTIVLFTDNSTNVSINANVISFIQEYQKRYSNSEIYVDVMDGQFSRAKALQRGANHFSADGLLFFVDVDMHFTRECLTRIRLNTIRGKQVYFPIIFSQYDPTFHSLYEKSNIIAQDVLQINDELGYWRQFGFGIVSLYHDDLNQTGGLDVTIQGWGKEDVDFYDKVVASNLTVFRAPDPSLVHIFHPVDCDPSLAATQLQMCLGSRASNYASAHKLTRIFYSDSKIVHFSKDLKLKRENEVKRRNVGNT